MSKPTVFFSTVLVHYFLFAQVRPSLTLRAGWLAGWLCNLYAVCARGFCLCFHYQEEVFRPGTIRRLVEVCAVVSLPSDAPPRWPVGGRQVVPQAQYLP